MDDDDRKKPRGPGAKPFAGKARDGGRPGSGRAAGAGKKPFRADAGKKPFRKPREDAAGERRPERPFVKRERPASAGDAARPRFDGKRGDKKPFVKHDAHTSPLRGGRAEGTGGGTKGSFTPTPARRADRPGQATRLARPSDPHKGEGKTADAAPGERIAKRLARVGIASRRDAEELIAAGRVKVNGKVLASPAFNVTVDDVIELDGTLLPPIERTRLFLFHKPAGVVTTNRDPEGRKTVFDVLPTDLPRLITVGRLDINTEGLLLLTNDGGLARVLELPATGWLRRYRARVHGKVDEGQLAGLKDGMAVGGVFYGAVEAALDREQGSNAWITIGLREGKNREVKNILGALGLEVTRLIRVSFGPFQLGELAEGHVQELKGRLLRDQLGERLIEESGANFDADIIKPFSNEPRRRAREKPVEAAAPARPLRDEPPVRIGEGGLIKRRQRRENTRDDALGKLSTRPERPKSFGEKPVGDKPFGDKPFGDRSSGPKPFGAKPFGAKTFGAKGFGASKGPRAGGKKGEREQRPIEPPGGRKANVWMAPGARPIGAGRAAAEKAEADSRKQPKQTSDFVTRSSRPSSGPPAGPSPRKHGEKAAFRNADAPLSPSSRGEGKGEGQRRGKEKSPRKGGPGADRRR